MTKPIEIADQEHGIVRVFALSLTKAQAESLRDNKNVQDGRLPQEMALGARTVDARHVEVFDLSDLGDMTLAAYLIEGAGADPARIEPDRARLAALEGWVMIVYSSAFGGTEQTITPAAALTLIGSYPQENVDWSGSVDLRTPSALPNQEAPAKKRPSDAAMSGRIATIALLVAFAVVGLMVWVGS